MKLEKINVLLILDYGALGGAERQAFGLGKYLKEKRECNVDLLLLKSDYQTREFTEYSNYCGIRNVFYIETPYLFLPKEFSYKNLKRIKWNIQTLLRFRAVLKAYDYDILIPFLNFPSKISYYLYKILPTVKFTFWHQLGLDTIKNDLIEKIAVNNVPCVIGNAPNCFEMFQDLYSISSEKLNLLPQYLTLNVVMKDKNDLRKKFNIPEDAITIGMIANYREDKYFDLLMDAFVKIYRKTNVKIHLVLLGNKKNNEATLRIYNELLEKSRINNITEVSSILSNEEVVDVLNILDVAVLMSKIEGMPNSVMEYMAYGIPAIVTNHPGCKQLLENSEYLIPNDVDILSLKIEKLINDRNTREIEGQSNLERIKKFNLPSYVSNLEQIINKYL